MGIRPLCALPKRTVISSEMTWFGGALSVEWRRTAESPRSSSFHSLEALESSTCAARLGTNFFWHHLFL